MSLQYIQKIETPKLIEVKIKKVFDEKVTEWEGKEKRNISCVVIYQEKEYYAKFNPKQYPIAVEGNIVSGVREEINGNPYFQWMSGGDGLTPNPQSSPAQSQPLPPPPTVEAPTPVQQNNGTLAGRGACFNLAFQYCLFKTNSPTMDDMLKDVVKYADQIQAYQTKYVNQ